MKSTAYVSYILAFIADKFVTDTVLIQTLLNNALVDSWRVLPMLVILAFEVGKFFTDAEIIETLLNGALNNSCNIFLSNKLVIDAVLIQT